MIWTPETKIYAPDSGRLLFPGQRGFDEAYQMSRIGTPGDMSGGFQSLSGASTELYGSNTSPPLSPALNLDPSLQLWQNVGGTTPAVTNLDPVNAWTNQGSLGGLLTQIATAATFKTNFQNGQPIVFFNDNSALKVTFTWNQPITIFVAAQVVWTVTPGNACIFDGGSVGTFVMEAVNPSPNWALQAGGSADPTLTSWTTNTWGIACCIFDGSSSAIRLNAGSQVTGNPGTHAAGGFTVGGNANGSTGFLFMNVAQILGYSSHLSTGDETTVRNWLNAKYAIF